MGGPLSYPAHISAVSALIKDTGQIGSWLDWEAHAIPRFRRFREEIVLHTAHRPPQPCVWEESPKIEIVAFRAFNDQLRCTTLIAKQREYD